MKENNWKLIVDSAFSHVCNSILRQKFWCALQTEVPYIFVLKVIANLQKLNHCRVFPFATKMMVVCAKSQTFVYLFQVLSSLSWKEKNPSLWCFFWICDYSEKYFVCILFFSMRKDGAATAIRDLLVEPYVITTSCLDMKILKEETAVEICI